MNLFGIDQAQQASSLFTLTGANRRAAGSADTADNGDSEKSQAVVMHSANLLARNFVHSGREESRYITGLKTGLAMQNEFLSKMQSVVAGYKYLVDITGDPRYAEDAVNAVNSMVEDEVEDTNNEKIEEMREDIEEKAEEAVTPESEKVMENKTSPQEALEDSLEEAAPEEQAQAENGHAAPTEPGANAEPIAASKPDGAEAAAEDPAEQDATARQDPPGEAPATPSIDIMV